MPSLSWFREFSLPIEEISPFSRKWVRGWMYALVSSGGAGCTCLENGQTWPPSGMIYKWWLQAVVDICIESTSNHQTHKQRENAWTTGNAWVCVISIVNTHTENRVVMMLTLSLLVAPEVVVTSDDKVGIMTTHGFQWMLKHQAIGVHNVDLILIVRGHTHVKTKITYKISHGLNVFIHKSLHHTNNKLFFDKFMIRMTWHRLVENNQSKWNSTDLLLHNFVVKNMLKGAQEIFLWLAIRSLVDA